MIKLFSYLQEKQGISRREYMRMLQEHAVKINNTLVESMNAMVNVWDMLTVQSWKNILLSEKIAQLQKKKKMIVLFNKPKGYTVAKEDKHNKTIYELLPASRQKDFYYIGRLDKDSHGLLLLTNDPGLVDYYEKPTNKIHKIYEVEIDKPIKSQHVEKAKKGIVIDDQGVAVNTERWLGNPQTWELLKALNIRYQLVKGKYFVIITLTEWKKRHIRRLLKGLGYMVKDLKRVKVGIYELGTIKLGKYMLQPYKEHKK